MVQNNDSGISDADQMIKFEHKNTAKGIEEGHYKLVGWAADTTGRRLIDEMCQIAGYTPESQFSQYIMPYNDIRLYYRRRHLIRVMNMGKYRILKNMKTNKVEKTKSEISALFDFLDWLESVRGDAKDGIILVFHEFHKTIPAMLLEALRKYNLFERFGNVVKGFANSFSLSQAKCANTTTSYKLEVMSKILLNKEDDLSSAVTRAQTCYEIAIHLGQSERNDLDVKGSGDAKINDEILTNMIRPFTNPISAEQNEIDEFKNLLKIQNTFKPIFGALLKATPPERQHASHLRRLLATNNIDYEKVKSAFDEKKLEDVLKADIPEVSEEDLKELVEMLDSYFDPEKKAILPKPKFFKNNYRSGYRNKKIRKPRQRKNNNNSYNEIKKEVGNESIKVEGGTDVVLAIEEA